MGNVDESQFDKYFFEETGLIKLQPKEEKKEKKAPKPMKLDENKMFTSDENPKPKEENTPKPAKRRYWDEWTDDGIAIRHYLEPGETEKQSRKKVKEERKRKEKEAKKKKAEEEEQKNREDEKQKSESGSNGTAAGNGSKPKQISLLTADGVEYIDITPSNDDKPKEKVRILMDGPASKEKKSEAPDKQAEKPTGKLELEKEAAQKPRKDFGVTIL